jgi:cation diffusion facilitator family transporter
MHTHDLSAWQHDHQFGAGNASAERSTRLVMWITAAMMVVEIGAGWWFNSMALLADGWHMSSHALAIGLSAFAYAAARRYARDPRFAFGTWKIEVLGGFASALVLLGIAALMVVGSLERLWSPAAIHYPEAIVGGRAGAGGQPGLRAAAGRHAPRPRARSRARPRATGMRITTIHHEHPRPEPALRLPVHVVADAATSVLAIAALLGGWFYGWAWLDPAMGIVGAVLVAVWAKGPAEGNRQGAARPRDGPPGGGRDPRRRRDHAGRFGNPRGRPARVARRRASPMPARSTVVTHGASFFRGRWFTPADEVRLPASRCTRKSATRRWKSSAARTMRLEMVCIYVVKDGLIQTASFEIGPPTMGRRSV